MTVGVAPGLELLEVREVADVDLRLQVAPNRPLERLARVESASGQRPRAEERLARPLPEQHLELAVPHLEDDGEHLVSRSRGRLRHELSTYSRKPDGGTE